MEYSHKVNITFLWTGKPKYSCNSLHWAISFTAVVWNQTFNVSQWSESESRSVVSNSLQPHGLYNPWNSPGHNTGVGSHSLLQGNLPNLGIKPRSPTLQVDFFLPAEPQGKPEITGVGNLPLLQGIFLTQESNWSLLHCRPILYQHSSQGSPSISQVCL